MSPEKSKSGNSVSELSERVERIKRQIETFEDVKRENSLALEREKAKHEMYISQLKELGYSYEGIDKKIAELSKEVEDAIAKAELVCKENGIDI